MIFLRHLELDTSAYLVMLEDFGIALGLHVNLNKCAALPIRHQQEHLQLISNHLCCPEEAFPCTYLGPLLSIRKQSAAQLQGN